MILIGDSGQQDPEIYAGVADDYAGRVLAIYLREVTGRPARIESIHRLRARLARRGIPVILAESVLPMAEHAAGRGWISQWRSPDSRTSAAWQVGLAFSEAFRRVEAS